MEADLNLKEIRTRRNMTQRAVADYIGCSSVVYSRYERGTRQPSIEMLLKLADLFGVTVD
jgi:transcriptional regulator with XRE-family HTH domain